MKAAGAPDTLSIACDASSKESVVSALAAVNQKLGAPNVFIKEDLITTRTTISLNLTLNSHQVLVYNAALMSSTKLIDTDYSKIEEANRVNLGGAINSVQAVLPFLREQKVPHLFYFVLRAMDASTT